MTERWEGLEVLARGANRLCARDPVNPTHCLKFELPGPERPKAGLRARFRRWLGRRFPRLGDNGVEWRAWQRLHRRHGDALAGRFAACHGVVDTRWGPALRCDCVLLDDGTPAPSLYKCLFGEPLPASPCGSRHAGEAFAAMAAPTGAPPEVSALCAAVDDFEAFLLACGIPLFDLNAGNFVVLPTGWGVRLVCVDAKSTLSGKELLPFSRWIPWLRRRKLRRRAERLRQRIRMP